jgi:hypothetical protein
MSSSELAELLAPFDVSALNWEAATIYGVSNDLRIIYVNRAWLEFAEANGAQDGSHWGVGSRVMDAIPVVLRTLHGELFERARRGELVDHEYDCSSPEMFRRYRMRIHRCTSGALLVVHSLVHESPRTGPACRPSDALYRDGDGLMTQCSYCRCVRRAKPPVAWDWVPEYAARPACDVSHGLCFMCRNQYYPDCADDPGEV